MLAVGFFLSTSGASVPWQTRNPRRQVTVDYLYEACSAVGDTARGDIPNFDCESYVYGVLDAYIAIRSRLPIQDRACFPADIEPWRALKIANPQPGTYDRSQSAATFLIGVMKARYPCRK